MKNYFRPLAGLLATTLALNGLTAFRPAGHPASPMRVQANEAVSVWLTYEDQTKLLQQQANVSFGADGASNPVTIAVDENTTYQSIDGFGAAMTGSSAYNLNRRLNASQRDALLNDLFSPSGANFSFMRHSIGASDFDLQDFTYDDRPAGQTDPSLSNFSINYDKTDLIPMLKAARVKNPNLRLVGTPWSAPAWMKVTETTHGSWLKDSSYPIWANYFVKYIQAYAAEGMPIYAITVQNEPLYATSNYPSMSMNENSTIGFVRDNLGPAFSSNSINTKIIVYDHNWDHPEYPTNVYADAGARQYIAGAAFHCYGGNVTQQNQTHDAYPDKGIWFTECTGTVPATFDLGGLAGVVIATTRNWAKSALLWNLVLDQNNGPTNNGCTTCTGLVTIDSNTGAVTKNSAYYIMAHASKFVKQGAVRIASNTYNGGIEDVAFKNPDGSKALVVFNNGTSQTTFKVRWGNEAFTYTLPSRGAATFTWSGTQNGTTPTTGGGGIVSGHTYKLTAKHSGQVLDVPSSNTADGIALQQWPSNGTPAQQWTVTDVGGGYYKLVNVNSGKGLDVRDVRTDDAAPIQQWTYGGGLNQQWSLVDAGGGYYNVVNRNSGKYMDVYGYDTNNGGQIVQYHATSADNQKWLFTDLAAARPASPLATATAAEELRLQVYPTVADQEIRLEYTAAQPQPLAFELVDLTGRVASRSTQNAVAGLNRLNVPVGAAAQGVYVLKVSTAAGLLTRRVVVAR